MTNTVKEVWVWILSFLKLKPQFQSISNNVIPISSRQQRKKIKRDSTLKDLLDNLDYAFNEIKVDYHRWSHISKKQIKGLKEIILQSCSNKMIDNEGKVISFHIKNMLLSKVN